MDTPLTAAEHFYRGEAALAADNISGALEHFRSAHRLEPANPRHRSYFGLCLGLTERRFDRALDLCRAAAKEEFFNPVLYRNLARVHLAFGFKAEGIRFLRRGLMIDPHNEVIGQHLEQMGLRCPSVLGFLRRRHVLNRWLGQLRYRRALR